MDNARPPLSDREIAESIPRPTGARCEAHNLPDCTPCRYLAQSLRENEERASAPPIVPRRSPQTVVLSLPSFEEQKRLEESVRQFLEGPVAPEQSTQPTSVRYFYQPLPRGSVREWPTDPRINRAHDGMTRENIASFLTMPEFIYSDYEKNKANGPKKVFITPTEAINRPHHKLLPAGFRRVDSKEDDYSVTHVGTEILQEATPIVIRIPASPPRAEWKRIPPPQALLELLEQAKSDHKLLLARHLKTLDKSARLTPKERASSRTLSLRKISKLEREVQSYKEQRLVNVPNTGREAVEITIPACPEGSIEIFPRKVLREYIRAAYEYPIHPAWDFMWAHFENSVIRRAQALNLLRGWPNQLATAQWWADGKPAFGSSEFRDRYGWHASKADATNKYLSDLDSSAKDAAELGYVRGEDGFVADESIRRAGPGTVGGWHGAGAGPDDGPMHGSESWE